MGREEASGEAERRGGEFEAADTYGNDLYWDSDYDHGSGVFVSVSNWRTSLT